MIVAGHIGYPWTDEMIALARKYPNVYIDTSAYTVRRYPRQLVEYLRGDGRTKVLFGTNYPMIPPEYPPRGGYSTYRTPPARSIASSAIRRPVSMCSRITLSAPARSPEAKVSTMRRCSVTRFA